MRRAIRVAENVAPAIIWLDEVEKAFPKTTGSGDSGASLRVMNTFLTWMQERKGKVFVVGTANDISQMPVELVRRGRFDEIFYVGLPDLQAREKIWEIHTCNIPLKEEHYKYLAARSRWYTGAEIEQLVKNTLFVVSRFSVPSAAILMEEVTANPFIRAVDYCMENFVPLANRKGKDGRGLIEDTLEKARAIAVPASEKFEEIPGLEKKGKDSLEEPMALTATRF
jgi:SpoVK/Ycf46/Vps4 family AAA+-type ATPase